jgi:DNA-binding PadR family transcriptional regulator
MMTFISANYITVTYITVTYITVIVIYKDDAFWMMTEKGLLEQQKLTVYSIFVLYFLLTEGPMSGYALAQLIKERSHGHFRATAGNVYPRLHELKEAGDVAAGEPTGGREKIVYTITKQGKQTLRRGALEQRQHVENLLKMIDHVVAITAPAIKK